MKSIFSILFLFILSISHGQEVAVTMSGDTVYLFDNGMWSYENEEPEMEFDNTGMWATYEVMDSTNTPFSVPKKSKKVIDKEAEPYTLAYNEDIWKRVPPSTINDEASYAFMTKNEELYTMLIYEEVEIGLNAIMNIAMSNIKDNLGVDPNILHSDYIMVNGKQMIHVTYEVGVTDMSFVFDSFYYSSEKGTYQYTAWTFSNIHKKNQPKILDQLAGLTVK